MNTTILILVAIIVLILLVFFSKNNEDDFYNNPGHLKSLDQINNKLKNISNCNISGCNVLTINGKTKKYIPATTPLQIRLDLDNITQIVLKKINCPKYNFINTNYGRITCVDSLDKINYIYEIFVAETKGISVSLYKMKINVILYKGNSIKDRATTVTDFTNYPFKHYDIGMPSLDQMIPLPTEVIPTGNEVLGTKSVNPIKANKINKLHINYATIENSTLVLHPNKLTNKIPGNNNSTLESSVIEGFDSGYIQPAVVRNNWPQLGESQNKEYNWPCTKLPFSWNSLGVTTPLQKTTKKCPGHTYSLDKPMNAYQDWSNSVMTPQNIRSGPNYWLFDLTRGLPSFNVN
tara:strand:- start:90 stop:1133 length:1044 start_codon:yes stop_codon:yes gene_type:complete